MMKATIYGPCYSKLPNLRFLPDEVFPFLLQVAEGETNKNT